MVIHLGRVAPFIPPGSERYIPEDEARTSAIDKLPGDLLTNILHVWTLCIPTKDVLTMRAVNKHWNKRVLDYLLKFQWEKRLRESPSGFIDICQEMRSIQATHIQSPTGPTSPYVHFFRKLMTAFKREGVKITTSDALRVTFSDYEILQQSILDEDIRRGWPEIRSRLLDAEVFCCFRFIPRLNRSAANILAYLHWEWARFTIGGVEKLKLEGCSLHRVPPAVCQFRNLTALDLSRNRIKHLSPFEFSRFDEHQDGQLVRAFPLLQILDLSDNPLTDFHIDISFFPRLRRLYLRKIANMDSFANIDTSYRANNSRLVIDFSYSKISTYAGDEAFFLGDTEQELAVDYITLRELKNHVPLSPLGRLYHAIIFEGKSDEELYAIFEELSPDIKTRVYMYVGGKIPTFQAANFEHTIEGGKSNLRSYPDLFKLSINHVIREVFLPASLSREAKNRIYFQIERLRRGGGPPSADRAEAISEGKKYRFYSLSQTADALFIVSQNLDIPRAGV